MDFNSKRLITSLLLTLTVVTCKQIGRTSICRQADIVFVLDESTSIQPSNFTKQLRFVSNLVEQMGKIGPNARRVALITFSTNATERFDLSRHSDISDILKAVSRIKQRFGQTNTSDALKLARKKTLSHGKSRSDVPRVIIVITDGNSQEPSWTRAEALQAKKDGIIIFAVGVGKNVERRELKNIAQSKDYIFMVDDYQKLFQIQQELGYKSCAVSIESSTAKPSSTLAPQKDEGKKTECGSQPSDIYFMLDSSKSIEPAEFVTMTKFVQSLVESFEISPQATRVAALTYSTRVHPAFPLTRYRNMSGIQEHLKSLTKISGNTNTARALRYVRIKGFAGNQTKRENAEKIVVLLTDGRSIESEKTIVEARQLRKSGVVVVVVGIGRKVDKLELDAIASWPVGQYVFTIQRFEDLNQIRSRLATLFCKERKIHYAAAHRECDVPQADIVIMMDESSSISQTDFVTQKNFLKDLIEKFKVNAGGTRVALITFGSYARVQFNLDTYVGDEARLLAYVSRMTQLGGDTNIGDALRIARRYSFHKKQGARDKKVPKIGIVITDGKSQESFYTKKQARFTKSVGIKLFAIGIGPKVSVRELHAISSKENFVFHVKETGKLKTIIEELKLETCDASILDLDSKDSAL